MRLIQSHKKGRIVCVVLLVDIRWMIQPSVVHLCCRFMSRFFCRLLRKVWWFYVIWKSSLKIEDAQMDLPIFLLPFAMIYWVCRQKQDREGGQIAYKLLPRWNPPFYLHLRKLFDLNHRCSIGSFGAGIGEESSWPLQGKQDDKWQLAA